MGRKSSLAEEAAPRCTRCGSERIVKNGKNACGRQQFRCRACGACRVLFPISRTAPPERQAEILRAAALERLSLRAAARVFAVGRGTLALWMEKKPKSCRL
jgi:transposase-like protein